jgi:hypothetical protein
MQSWTLPEIDTPDGSRSPLVLLSEDEARAVLIGLHPGQELGDHQVKEHAWIVVVDGSARIGAGGQVALLGRLLGTPNSVLGTVGDGVRLAPPFRVCELKVRSGGTI